MIDGKEYANQMRENAVIDKNGNIIVSEELWQQIANIIETQQAEIEICAEVIKRQDKEIERLKSENKILSKNADTAFQDGLNEAQDIYAEQIKNEVRAEAIKEFADRLKGELNNLEYHENTDRKTVTKVELYNFVNWIMRDVVPNEIDDLVKEMEDSRA